MAELEDIWWYILFISNPARKLNCSGSYQSSGKVNQGVLSSWDDWMTPVGGWEEWSIPVTLCFLRSFKFLLHFLFIIYLGRVYIEVRGQLCRSQFFSPVWLGGQTQVIKLEASDFTYWFTSSAHFKESFKPMRKNDEDKCESFETAVVLTLTRRDWVQDNICSWKIKSYHGHNSHRGVGDWAWTSRFRVERFPHTSPELQHDTEIRRSIKGHGDNTWMVPIYA